MKRLFCRSALLLLATASLAGCASMGNVPGPALPSTGWTDSMMKSVKSGASKTTAVTSQMGTSLKKTAEKFMDNGKQMSIPTSNIVRRSPRQRREQAQNLSVAVARTLERQGKTDQAAKAYQEAIDSGSKDVTAYHRLAVLYDKKGEYKKSNELYEKALDLAPQSAEILADLGYSLYLQKRYAEAEQTLKSALEYDADLPRARNNLALVLGNSQKLDDSFAEFRRAGADITDAHVNLGYVMMWRGDLRAAQEEFELALEIDGTCHQAREGLARIESLASRGATAQHGRRTPHPQPTVRGPEHSPEPHRTAEVVSYTSEWPRKRAY